MGGERWGEEEKAIYMPISTEGSGMPTTRPKTGSQFRVSGQGAVFVRGGDYLHAHIH